jgi:hypothetical protein
MRNPTTIAVGLGLVGAVVATVLGFLTFGAQATVAPDHLPLAVTVPEGAPPELGMAADRISSQGGDAVEWQVTDPAHARALLDDKEIYGILELNPGLALTIVTSGAVNPQGAQVAQQVLTGAAQGLSAALAQQGVQVTPPRVETVHAATTAARTAPLAASALLWIGGLAAAMAFGLLVVKPGGRTRTGARLALVASVSVFATAAVAGLLKLWDSSLNLSVDVLGFMLLTAVAFASVQGALLRLLHIRAAAILGPLYLLAPAVAGTVPEMLDPAYRTLLWSWTPFRFSTEGIRSLLQGVPDAPDVRTGIIVLASMAVAGLIVMAWPGRRQQDTAPVESRELVSSGS